MKRSWIFWRIFGAFAFLMVIFLIYGGLSYWGLEMQSLAEEEAARAMAVRSELQGAKSAHSLWIRNLQDMFLTGEVPKEPVDHTQCAFGLWYHNFEPDSSYAQLYQRIAEPHANLHAIGHQVWSLYAAGRTEDALNLLNNQMKPTAEVLLDFLNQVEDAVKEHQQLKAARAEEVHDYLQLSSLVFLALAMVVALITSQRTAKIIAVPLAAIATVSQKVAAGDLREKVVLPKARGEVAILASAFNRMVDSLREIVAVITEQASQATTASDALSSASYESSKAGEQVATTIQNVADNSTQIAGKIVDLENLAQVLNKVADQANQLSNEGLKIAEETADSVTIGNQAVQQSIQQLNKVSETVNFATSAIQQLGQRSEEIGEIVGLIEGIASQTNLLALNAAIEAARAGEQGRGFAVVAEEVRKLAAESADAAQKITDLIEDIISETLVTTQVMEVNSEEVAEQVSNINEAGNALGLIFEKAKHTRNAASGMTGISTELAARGQDLGNVLASIALAVQDNAAASQEVAASAEEQTATAEEVAASAQQLRRIVEELQAAVGSFQI